MVDATTAEIRRLVDSFVEQIVKLAQRAAIDALQGALSETAGTHIHGALQTRRRGEKRSPEQLAQLESKLAAFVRQHPGLRVEQINKQLGTTTKDLALPIRKLVANKVIRAKGSRRATMYLPAEGSKEGATSNTSASESEPPGRRRRSRVRRAIAKASAKRRARTSRPRRHR